MMQDISPQEFNTILDSFENKTPRKKRRTKKKPAPDGSHNSSILEFNGDPTAPELDIIRLRGDLGTEGLLFSDDYQEKGLTLETANKALKRHHGRRTVQCNPKTLKAPQIEPQGLTLDKFAFDESRIKLTPQEPGANMYKCVRGYIPGYTTDRVYHKVVVCGKENCDTCGKDYSVVHNRRVTRCYDKIMQLKKVGYMVVTVPKELRDEFLDKKVLSDFRNFIRRKLKAGTNTYQTARDIKTGKLKRVKSTQSDAKRGLIRYHWCGEDFTTWKPHLNIIMESGYWSPARLEQFRLDVGAWFEWRFNKVVSPNIHYAYTNSEGKVKHWLKYVLRPTAKLVTDRDILRTIYGYNNTGYYGKFEKVDKKRDAPAAILAGCDPETGERIQWEQIIKPSEFNTLYRAKAQKITIDTGQGREPIDFGLFVTELIDLIPAGVQLSLNDS